MQSLFKTAILVLAGLVAVTAFTLDAAPMVKTPEAQAATSVTSNTCPSNVGVNVNRVSSQYDAVPANVSNRFTYSISVSGSNASAGGPTSWISTSTANTFDTTLNSPSRSERITISYTKREIVRYTPVYRTDRVRVAPFSKSYRVYNPRTGRAETRWRTVYNYENRRVFVRNDPVYGDVRYSCSAIANWSLADRSIDVIHAENFFVSSPSRMPDGPWLVRATHGGADNLTGNISIPVNGQDVAFRFSGGKTATASYLPGRLSGNSAYLNADISGFSPGHSVQSINQRFGTNILSSANLVFRHDRGNESQTQAFGKSITINPSFKVGPPNITPSLGGAKSNWYISRDRTIAPYAASYSQSGRVAPCRANMANPDTITNATARITVIRDHKHRNQTIQGTNIDNIDIKKTLDMNPWLELNSAYVDSQGNYRVIPGSNGITFALGKTATIYQNSTYTDAFKRCFEAMSGYPLYGINNFKLYEKIDLTSSHPSRISYIFLNGSPTAVGLASGGDGLSPRNTMSAVQCLPEARGIIGLDIYDTQQGDTNGIYASLFPGGANRLNRDNFYGDKNNYAEGGFAGWEGDIWVTGFSPATNRFAPGARNPRATIQCDYAKGSSVTAAAWDRNNPYLGVGKAPVYVGDTIRVSGASASKVGDPGRRLLGNITIRLSGPGYNQIRTCANPCGVQNFPAITQSGTFTITASWGGDAGLNGSSFSQTFVANKYNTQLSFNTMLNNQGAADFTSTKPVPISNTHLQNTSITWIPTVPAGDMGSGTLQVTVQQLQKNGSWANYASTITNANCLMSSNPCASEVGALIAKQGQYRVQLRYIGNNKYNASTAAWSNTFWVYEDFRCVGINNADGVSMQLQWFENNTQKTAFSGNVLRNGNPMIISHPSVDGSGFTGIVRLDKIETSSYFMGTPLADGTNVRLFEMPAGLTATDVNKLLRGEYAPSLREYSLKPGMPSSDRYIFDNVRTYNSWPLNDAGGFKTVVRVYEISDLTDPGLKMMQELRVYGIYYKDGVRQTGSIACEDVDAPQTGFLKFNKVTIIQ